MALGSDASSQDASYKFQDKCFVRSTVYLGTVPYLSLALPAIFLKNTLHGVQYTYSKISNLNKRARVSLILRLICRYLLRSLLPFLTCIYDTLLDLEIYNMRVSSGKKKLNKVHQAMPSIFGSKRCSHPRPKPVFTNGLRVSAGYTESVVVTFPLS